MHRLLLTLLLALAPFAANAAKPADALVEGRDYALIEGGAPWQPLNGRIEVVEVFSYTCHHCANFQPMVDAWKRKLGKDVRFTYVPLPNGGSDALARGFFATSATGKLDKVHSPLFAAIHQQRTVPGNPSTGELAAWYAGRGLDAARLAAAMDSPAMAGRLDAARDFAIRSGVEGTPTLVINGRYRVLGRSFGELLEHADALIAQLRTAR